VNPLSFSPVVVRALYALQLEMDCVLPNRMCALGRCQYIYLSRFRHLLNLGRLWAEERYKLKRQKLQAQNMSKVPIVRH
jgi:hypothetical protein